jgi:hypothetical protein
MVLVLECIGLLLGVTPLIIEALKANPEPIDAFKATKTENAREILAEFYTDLGFEVSMLKITLTALVKELPIETALKEKLTNEKTLNPMIWKLPPQELQDALERRLSPCYESFVQSMQKLLRLLANLVEDKSLPCRLTENQIVSVF